MQHRKDEPEVGRDGSLARQKLLDALLDREVLAVDLVIEGDDLLGQLDVLAPERAHGSAQRANDESGLALERLLELGKLLLKGDPHPNRPVT